MNIYQAQHRNRLPAIQALTLVSMSRHYRPCFVSHETGRVWPCHGGDCWYASIADAWDSWYSWYSYCVIQAYSLFMHSDDVEEMEYAERRIDHAWNELQIALMNE